MFGDCFPVKKNIPLLYGSCRLPIVGYSPHMLPGPHFWAIKEELLRELKNPNDEAYEITIQGVGFWQAHVQGRR
jgi:hypothetical protein